VSAQELLWAAFRERQRAQRSEGLFHGCEFWVISGERSGPNTKEALETLILQNGGQVVRVHALERAQQGAGSKEHWMWLEKPAACEFWCQRVPCWAVVMAVAATGRRKW